MDTPRSTANGPAVNHTARPGGRTLVLCFDGTSNHYQEKNTNVVKLFSLLERKQTEKQKVYYQTGIGTYEPPGFLTSTGRWLSKVVDLAVACYLSQHVCAGYRFLMDTYTPGDRICLFGFSRGAYTARALAAMLRKVGLLPCHNEEHIRFAWNIFNRTDDDSWGLSDRFRRTFSRDVEIEFVGVWDTVSSVGIIPRSLPNTAYNPIIKTFRHALALDERRILFRANYWRNSRLPGGRGPTDVKEVWFAGAHTDVGGGAVCDTEPNSLAYIALRWMVRECMAANAGLIFDSAGLAEHGIIPLAMSSGAGEEKEQPKLSEAHAAHADREKHDALRKSHSAFSKINFWWPLELIPMKRHLITNEAKYKSVVRVNMLRGRDIWPQVDPIQVHSSVRTRMQQMPGYEPKAKWPGEPVFVD